MNEPHPTPASPGHSRPAQDRLLLGVCADVARRAGLSVPVVRTIVALLGIVGVGIPVYVALAVALRSGPSGPGAQWRTAAISGIAILAVLAAARAVLGMSVTWSPALVLFGLGAIAIALAAVWRSGAGGIESSRLLAGAVAGIATLFVATAVWAVYGLPTPSDPIVFALLLLGAGAALVFGRRGSPAAQGTVARPEGHAGRTPFQPPILLLLTVAGAAIAATAVWIMGGNEPAPVPFGTVAAAALVVVGLGQVLGAWRGRSLLLLPIGAVIAVPLALAAYADIRILELGSDDPGRLPVGPVSRTYDLGRGAAPVVVTRAAVAGGLRDLTIRKPAGTIALILPDEISARVSIAAALPADVSFFDEVKGLSLTGAGTYVVEGRGKTAISDVVDIRVETFAATVAVTRQADPGDALALTRQTARTRLAGVRADIAARSRLLARERITLRGLTSRYAAARAALAGASPDVTAPLLATREDLWPGASADSPWLVRRDPALAAIEKARALRFDMLRAAWRVRSVEQGIRQQRLLERKLAIDAREAP